MMPIWQNKCFSNKVQFLRFGLMLYLYCKSAENSQTLRAMGTTTTFQDDTFEIEFDSNIPLNKFNRQINIKKIAYSKIMMDRIFSVNEETVCLAKLQVILARVKQILNSYPKNRKRLKLRLFADASDLKKTLVSIDHPHAKAYYKATENTIYCSFDQIDEYILAHEMAHAVIQNYFIVPPSTAIHEILAIHCDEQLKES